MVEKENKSRQVRYFVELSYLGTNFSGWQVQPGERTVQGVLIDYFSTFFRTPVYVVGAGRTDTGVHALQMFAHFDLNEKIDDPNQAVFRLNRMLPEDIALKRFISVPRDAHVRFQATERTYCYRISRAKNPFAAGMAWSYGRELDFEAMREAASILKEYSDFSSFCKEKNREKSAICDLRETRWEQDGDEWVFYIRANRFLRNMVRAIVGTLVEVGEKKRNVKDMHALLQSGQRSHAGRSAPACGLYLIGVEYPQEVIPKNN